MMAVLRISNISKLGTNKSQIRPGKAGFTLAELLIALAILGVIATFTIPKVLNSQQSSEYNAIAKEAAGFLSEALQQYRLDNTLSASTTTADLTPYLNYVAVDTSSIIDHAYTLTSQACGGGARKCLQLHNGAKLFYFDNISFGGTAVTNAIYFYVDPDGGYSGSTTGSGKSIPFFLYFNGRLSDFGNILTGTTSSGGVEVACPTCVPPWFSW